MPEPSRRDFLAGAVAGAGVALTAEAAPARFEPVQPPPWVHEVTRMAYLTPDQVADAARAGAQVIHTNIVWPHFPLRRDGGGLPAAEAKRLERCVADCKRHKLRLILGLPPFPPVALMTKHPDWRVHPDDTGKALAVEPRADDLGTRLACNAGPWGDYLIDVCVELVRDHGVDGFSFDGNYHPPLCYCPACKAAYKKDAGKPLPAKVDLDDIAYREYLVWRGERLEQHYRQMQQRLKATRADAVLMSWTVNAGRYGHFLHSPRAMPARLNQLFDLPMQEWWLDETNLGGSLMPAFGAAYLRAVSAQPPPVHVVAPMCVQATCWTRTEGDRKQLVVHLFNNLDTTAHHGQPGTGVPLREETVPVHGIRVTFTGAVPKKFHVEPGGLVPKVAREGTSAVVELPPLEIHALLVGEFGAG